MVDGQEPRYARDIATLYDQIVRPGWAAGVTADLPKLLGRELRTFADFATDNGDAFRATA